MTKYNDALVLYNMSSVIYGGTVAASWQIDIYGSTGLLGSPLIQDSTFKSASITWSLDGPGSAEITMVEDDAGAVWLAGRRRVAFKRNGSNVFTGYLGNVRASSSGYPHMTQHDANVNGWASILDMRVVHGDFNEVSKVGTTLAWDLINHTNVQEDTGIRQGSTTGTATTFTRYLCDGDVISEEITHLAERDTGGFDWEVDPSGNFNTYVGGRGTDKSGTITLLFDKRLSWEEEYETDDVVTYATALGKDPDGPCGPPLSVQTIALTEFPRREVVVEAERFSSSELADAALDEIKARQRARVRVNVTMHVDDLPWTWGTTGVWLGDIITVDCNPAFGGPQKMRCIEINSSLEAGANEFLTYTFESSDTGSTSALANGPGMWFAADSISQADASAVSQWSDISGWGRHLTQGTGANQPTFRTNIVNGKPVVRFDGTSDFLSGAAMGANPSELTVIMVARQIGATSVGRFWNYGNGSEWQVYGEDTYPTGTWGFYNTTGAAVRIGTRAQGSKTENWTVVSWINESLSVGKGYINGALLLTVDPVNTAGNTLALGAHGGGGGEWTNCEIAEIILWPRKLKVDERRKWERYLATKYNISITNSG